MTKKRLVLIGNGVKMGRMIRSCRMSKFIDESDVVFRINKTLGYNKYYGSKTDILGLVNVGIPAIEFVEKFVFPPSIISQLKEVWFSRPERWMCPSQSGVFDKKTIDLSDDILHQFGIDKTRSRYPDIDLYKKINLSVNESYESIQYQPSSGFVFLNMILDDKRYINYDFHLVGFTWKGWDGHNWKVEKNYCKSLHSDSVIHIW